jgi:hypothetical protein
VSKLGGFFFNLKERSFSACEIDSMSDDSLMLALFVACTIIAAGALVMLFLLIGRHGAASGWSYLLAP